MQARETNNPKEVTVNQSGLGIFHDQIPVQVADIPNIPQQVNLDDVKNPGLLLLNPEQISLLKKQSNENGFYAAEKTGLRYDVIKHEDQFWVIYNAAIGEGNHGAIKLIQNLSTGKFYALKQTDEHDNARREFNVLKDLGLTPISEPLPIHEASNQSLMIMELAIGKSADAVMYNETCWQAVLEEEPQNNAAKARMLPYAARIQIAIEILKEIVNLNTKNGYFHRDLIPNNVVIDAINQTAKLVDYGFALPIDNDDNTAKDRLTGSTLCYAPELRKILIAFLNKRDEILNRQKLDESGDDTEIPVKEKLDESGDDTEILVKEKLDESGDDTEIPVKEKESGGEKGYESDAETFDNVITNTENEILKLIVTYSEKTEIYGAAFMIAELFYMIDPSFPGAELDVREWENRSYILQNVEEGLPNLPGDLYGQVLAILHEMTNPNVDERCTFSSAIEKFEGIKAELLHQFPADAKVDVGVLNVEEYLACDSEERAKLIDKLRTHQEIWLIDTARTRSSYDHVQVKRELEQAEMHVGDKVFQCMDDAKAQIKLDSHLSQRQAKSKIERVSLQQKQLTLSN